MKPSHDPASVPLSASSSIISSSPPSPSNPPSPNSARDVPLLRLDQHHQSSVLPASTSTSTCSPVRRLPTMHPTTSSSSVASASSSSNHPTPTKSTLINNPRERKQSNPLRQFRSNASLGATATTTTTTTTTLTPNRTSATSSRFGQAHVGPNSKGKDRYSDAPEGGATDDGRGAGRGTDEDEDEERELMTKGRPGMRGRGESEGGFDEGWTNDGLQQHEEEEMGLLAGKKKPSSAADRPTDGAHKGVWSRQGSINPQRGSSLLTKAAQEAAKPSKKSRTILFNQRVVSGSPKYPPNLVKNQKYNIITFVPMVLYEQFKFFYNLYFLLVALSQFVPALRIGALSPFLRDQSLSKEYRTDASYEFDTGFLATYIVPLSFVLAVTISKEAFDDYKRYLRDASANATRYNVVVDAATSRRAFPNSHHASEAASESRSSSSAPLKPTPSAKLKVGDLVHLEKNERVPADILLLRTSDPSGSCFVRTDQLDGETDWKLRLAVERTQRLPNDSALLKIEGEVYADPPSKDIHNFIGTVTARIPVSRTDASMEVDEVDALEQGEAEGAQAESITTEPLTAENMLWANTVLAAGSAVGMVVYTGKETRAVMNTSQPGTKTGLLDDEINRLAKILCGCTFTLSVILVALNGFRGNWPIYVFRFLILFSSIIPISLRVNLDMGKTVYAHQIMNDSEIPETIVRTSTLPEELGRIEYLLSDKTGTLTQNEMELKKLHLGTMSYAVDSMDEVAHQLSTALGLTDEERRAGTTLTTGVALATRGRRDMSSRVKDIVLALALCHNVTPALDDDGSITYQASSPDEVAIVRWTESVGLTLSARDRTSMSLRTATGQAFLFDILEVFPFTSESKRMGIVIRDRKTGEIFFYQKGADAVMAKIVVYNDWLEEECGNMAREGLRTLVMARKRLSEEAWARFDEAHREAKIALGDRAASIQRVIGEHLERDLELLGVTGVEDKLQDDVKMTIELLRNAGIKIWMLTGDKIETATCIAISTKLVSRNQFIHQVAKLKSPADARDELDFLQTKLDCCLVIDGESLQLCIEHFREDFIALSTKLSTVVACRCSPTQKADVARLIRAYTRKRVCCIGDGGNDVSMIQAADVGVGIVGKEGRQASLAADFSINQFSYLTKLLVWHGRNSYKRSAKLAQFVIHRGLIISVIQAVFSSVFYFSPIAIYQGWLMVGYATAYTMLPVFSLVLDRDVNEDVALLYPELYKELTKGRALSYKTFFTWLMISIYQGGTIMIASLVLFESEFLNIVSISFTALVLNELIMVAVEVTTWHTLMILSEVITLGLYVTSILFLPEYFDLNFVISLPFVWKVGFIVAVSAAPLWIIKLLKGKFAPTQYAKLRDFAA
ncbi:BQ2448_6930 [Microbotryum intermedium]|uniref:Phospholipid-transporting ATPase n=1 Tax=Microbotryum intermedium TaxID=269621 RepID=A0A238FIL8_9BASI|nr:BQ2448_6930 [Microbotryum intermedium]